MGKRSGRRRKFRRYMRGKVNVEEDVGTIGAKAVNLQAMPDAVTEKTWISSIVASWALSNYTPVADAGPLMVGWAHSDYTSAEVEEYIENVGSWQEGNLRQQEIGRRKIVIVGIFDAPDAVTDESVLFDGAKRKQKLGWMLMSGQTVNLLVYNLGGVSISGASTPNLAARGHANLWPA